MLEQARLGHDAGEARAPELTRRPIDRREVAGATVECPRLEIELIEGVVEDLVRPEGAIVLEPRHERERPAGSQHAPCLAEGASTPRDELEDERRYREVEPAILERQLVGRDDPDREPLPTGAAEHALRLRLRDLRHPRRDVDADDRRVGPARERAERQLTRTGADVEDPPGRCHRLSELVQELLHGGREDGRPVTSVAARELVEALGLVDRHATIVPRSRHPARAVGGYGLGVALPFQPPIEPMLAKAVDGLPTDDGWLFEPKWDGFRALVFRDGDAVYTQSRDLKPLDRYFPELAVPLKAALPDRCVLDGEIVIAREGTLDFEALLLRIHPAASRVNMLAAESPASYVAWDLLALGDEDLLAVPQGERRERLERELRAAAAPIHLTPATHDRDTAADWFDRFEGAGLDGVVAKRLEAPYQPGKRAMLKIKHQRTADCVVAGFRWHKNGPGTHIGSLLLGLYDDAGKLNHVGITSSFSWDRREALAKELEPLRENAVDGHPWQEWAEWAGWGDAEASGQRLPGATSRWNRGKDLSWQPLRIERVAEVAYDHLQGSRFRHATTFKRWRPDKPPEACRYDQLEETAPYLLASIFGE